MPDPAADAASTHKRRRRYAGRNPREFHDKYKELNPEQYPAEMQKILQNLAVVIEDVAKKKSYDLVFERGSGALLYASKIDDITDEVVKGYNAKHKAGEDAGKPSGAKQKGSK